MTILNLNSSFKVQGGPIPTVEGIVPEAGALVYAIAEQKVLVGDGFKWTSISSETGANSSLSLISDQVHETILVSGTPVTPIDFFDEVVGQVGTKITATPEDTVNFAADMTVDVLSIVDVMVDQPNVHLIVRTRIGGVVVGTRDLDLVKDTWTELVNMRRYVVLNTNTLTLELEANKNCTVSITNARIGVAEV